MALIPVGDPVYEHDRSPAVSPDDEPSPPDGLLLVAGWFFDSYMSSILVSDVEARLIHRMRSEFGTSLGSMTQDEIVCRLEEFAESGGSDDDLQASKDALLNIGAAFQEYVKGMPTVIAKFNAGAKGDAYLAEYALDRVRLAGPHWSRNLDFYRGTVQTSAVEDGNLPRYTLNEVIDAMAKIVEPEELFRVLQTPQIFDFCFPIIAANPLESEHYAATQQPLLDHEVFWISRDKTALVRLRSMLSEVLRCYGVVEVKLNTFVPVTAEQDLEAIERIVAAEKDAYMNRLTRIVKFLLALGRRRMSYGALLAIFNVPPLTHTIGDSLRDFLPEIGQQPEDAERAFQELQRSLGAGTTGQRLTRKSSVL